MRNLKRGFPKEVYMVFVDKDGCYPIIFQTFKAAREYMNKSENSNLVLLSLTGPTFRLVDLPETTQAE